jgi:hypothetical protein
MHVKDTFIEIQIYGEITTSLKSVVNRHVRSKEDLRYVALLR